MIFNLLNELEEFSLKTTVSYFDNEIRLIEQESQKIID